MELTNCLKIIEIIVFVASVAISVHYILKKIEKNRNLETIKYLFAIRKEIWDLDKESKLTKLSKKQMGQKLEYLATAVNNNVLDFNLVKKSCGRWFQAKVRKLEIVKDNKKKESDNESYEEIEKLYKKLNESYNNN